MAETTPYIQSLLEANPIREPVLRAVIQALRLPAASRGLDVGCGIGLQSMLLAEAVGAGGHVTGLDISPEMLVFGGELVAKAGLSERIAFREGDASRLPFAGQSFDWVWSADCIGYPSGDLAVSLRELTRVVKPGGSVILLAWSSQQVLPGRPLLEARLNAACSSYFPYLRDKAPDQHFLRGLHWFQETGLENVRGQTFVGEVQAPLTEAERKALASLFAMLWMVPASAEPLEDWREAQRLCRPDSPDCILDEPGYYAFFTYTVFRGRVPGW